MFRVIALVSALTAVFSGCHRGAGHTDTPIAPPANNALTADEIAEDWRLLFDGSSLSGWKRYNADSIGPLWKIEEGTIVCDGKGLTEGTTAIGGSLMTTRQFGNFELSLEWKISSGGNSGILYHVVEDKKYQHDYETGPEYQVIDDKGWEGDSLRSAQKAGSNYDMYAASAGKKLMPAGEWNSSRIRYQDGHVVQWLNDEKVVEFDEGSDDFKNRHAKSKWPQYPDWNKVKMGFICLQDHGSGVSFKNIKIKPL